MKKPLAITFLVDEKLVRKSLAIITGEVLSDEQLEEKFFKNPVEVDLIDEIGVIGNEMTMAFVALIEAMKEK